MKSIILSCIRFISNKLNIYNYSTKQKRHLNVGSPLLWKMKRQFQFDFLKGQKIMTTDLFLDIGCGTLRGGIPIIRFLNEGNYFGLEVRKEVLREAQKELLSEKLENKKPTLIFFDNFNELQLNKKFDVIFAFSVLFHMSDKIVEECFSFIKDHMQLNGVFYANVKVNTYNIDSYWNGFPVVSRPIEFYYDLAKKSGFKIINLGTLKSLAHNSGIEKQDNQEMLRFEFLDNFELDK